MNTNKNTIKSISDKTFDTCGDERVVIYRDEHYEWVREAWDHVMVLWSNIRDYRGDKNAESPFEEKEDGKMDWREGVIGFPVSIYDHSGISYSLGDGRYFPDYQWDVVSGAFYLWCDREHYDKMWGNGAWDKFATDDERKEKLREIALNEVKELNLDASDMYFGWRLEKRRGWTKTYTDGKVITGHDWECDDIVGGYLTDDVNNIDFPRDVPVFAENGTPFVGDEYEETERR